MTRIHTLPTDRPESSYGIVTVSPQMRDLFTRMVRAARTDAAVLVRGESGTGKELVAAAVHACSARASAPFRAVNCATLTGELLASELFGHVRGAFTGAVRPRQGLFQLADGGTLFLDEVAELPLDIQARLLRVLQNQTFVPLGASEPVRVDVRLISATHRALRTEVAEHRFREDLMYRIRVVVLYIPRLVERDGDLEALTWHFVRQMNARPGAQLRRIDRITDDALQAMRAYPWPGNVRELQNNLEQAYAIGEGPILTLSDLAPEVRGVDPPRTWRDAQAAPTTLEDQEREELMTALRATGGRRAEAATRLGMSRSTLWRKLKQHGLA